jgi:hypothetical protein
MPGMRTAGLIALAGLVVGYQAQRSAGAELAGFEKSYFDEQVCQMRVEPGVRVVINAPKAADYDADRPTLLVFYAIPNGNSIEQTLGCKLTPGMDWHFDIQHVAAQIRRLREVDHGENIVLACIEVDGKSWPSWRAGHANAGELIRKLESSVIEKVSSSPLRVALAAHSGGGSFIIGYLNAYDHLPSRLERIVFLDANYAYSDDEHHGDKLLEWLNADGKHRLVVIAYDDRNITLNGKPVLKNPNGGTFGSSNRMIERFGKEVELSRDKFGDFDHASAMDGRIQFFIHPNRQNKILHTVLVGEMNGLIEGLTLGTENEKSWGTFGGPRAYTQWIQPAEGPHPSPLPEYRERGAGAALLETLLSLPTNQREEAIAKAITAGDIPPFLLNFKTIHSVAKDSDDVEHQAIYQVAPDYLSIGNDQDFVRIPLTPVTAQKIADHFDCVLPTRKLVDDIYSAADVKLEPRPLTEQREALATFMQHNKIIEEQRKDHPLGELIGGIKKDVVITNRLKEKPARVAIYGWHKLDGKPIQPLTIVHGQNYVDYSHGIRLVKRQMTVDGKPMTVEQVLADPKLCILLSDEGPITVRYP